MDNTELVKSLMTALDAGDIAKAKSLLTDDFQISGPFPEPMGKDQWMGMQAMMKGAFPDWSFNLGKVEDHGDYVRGYYGITGTHMGELDLSPMGLPSIPATSKKVSLPPEHADASFKDGKISSLKVHSAEGGGLPGLLHQLGVG